MTTLEQFMEFAEALPSDSYGDIELTLAAMMDAHSDKYAFTASELAELNRRVADPNHKYARPEAITAIFGKPFIA